MIRHYCDKCGKEIIKDSDSKFIDIARAYPSGRAVFTDYTFELCNSCLEGLAKYLGTEINEEKNFGDLDDKKV